jgi:nucleoside-diphosphate-sugar epimerase
LKNILVTGSGGFIGSAVSRLLDEKGMTVIPFDLEQGDITDDSALIPFEKLDISHVVHLAGRTFVPDSWKNPAGFYRINFTGTVNILEFCRRTGASLTYVSSYLYGAPEYLPVDENHPVKAYNPYSHSKVLADNACQFYAANFNLKVTILRPFNAFGPGQPSHFIIPEIIAKVKDPDQLVVRVMDLRPRRDYVFIDDLAEAVIASISGKQGIYNVGSGASVSVEDIIRKVMEITGITKPYADKGVVRQNEIFDLYSSVEGIKAGLNWEPRTSFDEGLRKCINP